MTKKKKTARKKTKIAQERISQPTAVARQQPAEDDAIVKGFHAELKRLIDEDRLTAKTLNLISQTASAALQILRNRNPRIGCSVTPYSGYSVNYGTSPYLSIPPMDVDSSEEGSPAPSPAMDRETFGAKILREFTSALPQIARAATDDPAKLVEALSVARDKGLTDIATSLEQRLQGNYALPEAKT